MATLKITDSTKIEITSFKNDGGRQINIRKFYKTQKSDEWLPTKQGLTIPEDKVVGFVKRLKIEFQAIEENAVELGKRAKKGTK